MKGEMTRIMGRDERGVEGGFACALLLLLAAPAADDARQPGRRTECSVRRFGRLPRFSWRSIGRALGATSLVADSPRERPPLHRDNDWIPYILSVQPPSRTTGLGCRIANPPRASWKRLHRGRIVPRCPFNSWQGSSAVIQRPFWERACEDHHTLPNQANSRYRARCPVLTLPVF